MFFLFVFLSDCKYLLFRSFRYFGRRFSFRTVDLSRESRVVPPYDLRFSRKRIEIIFGGCWGPRKLKSAKNNPHVFLDKTAKIWQRENIPLYGNQSLNGLLGPYNIHMRYPVLCYMRTTETQISLLKPQFQDTC